MTNRPKRYGTDAIGYDGMHQRVRKLRGPARQQVCPCGKAAEHWAYDHSDPEPRIDHRGMLYSLDPWRYAALCTRCHAKLDGEILDRRGRRPPLEYCKRGHEMTPGNTIIGADGGRRCRECRKATKRQWAVQNRPKPTVRTHCPHGHEYTPENTYVSPKGHRRCRKCHAIETNARYHAKRAANLG